MVEDYAEKSFWLGNSGEYKENPPLEGDLKCDVAIAGAVSQELPRPIT